MITTLDWPNDELDHAERSFVVNIRQHGWLRTAAMAEDRMPGFSYTTGFVLSAGQPELIIFSTDGEVAHEMFWVLFRRAKTGRSLAAFTEGAVSGYGLDPARIAFLGYSNGANFTAAVMGLHPGVIRRAILLRSTCSIRCSRPTSREPTFWRSAATAILTGSMRRRSSRGLQPKVPASSIGPFPVDTT